LGILNEQGSVPVPDPTKLTTDAVNAALDITRREMKALEEQLTGRMNAMDGREKERIEWMKERFTRVESLRVEQKEDVKAAVDAALAAQKEAINKSEQSTKEQISALSTTATTAYDSIRRDIDDLKGRVTVVESVKVGIAERRSQATSSVNLWIGVLSAIAAFLGLAIVIILSSP
jgi:hypothetical protein